MIQPEADGWGDRKLPAELRNNIYKHCLQTPGGVVKLAQQGILPSRSRKRLVQGFDVYDRIYLSQKSTQNLALLRASKVVYQEAVGFVYGQEFHFKNLPAMWTFLSRLATETKCLLRHLQVKLSESEWNFLPAVCGELPVEGSNLERLIIPNLGGHVGVGNPYKYLQASHRPVESLDHTLATLDTVIGIVMAKAVYDFMHPFVIKFSERNDVEKLVDMLNVFKIRPHLDYKFWRIERRFDHLANQPWSKARADRARTAMIQEIEDLVEEDNA